MITIGSGELKLGSSTSAFDREMIVRGAGTCTGINGTCYLNDFNSLSYTSALTFHYLIPLIIPRKG